MNREAFNEVKARIISSVPPECGIRIFIENYDTGYMLSIKDGNIQVKQGDKAISDDVFLAYVSIITPDEFYMFCDDLTMDYVGIGEVKRNFKFIMETRMLIIETYFRNEKTSKILDYSLYKHLNMYYNCRAKSNHKLENPKIPQTLCGIFKAVYLATPAFTAYSDGEFIDYLDMQIKDVHNHIKPTYSTKFEPINSMPRIRTENLEDKNIDIYTFETLLELVQSGTNLIEDSNDNWVLAESLQRAQYNESIFVEYWYTDLLKCIIDPEFASQELVLRSYQQAGKKMYYTLTSGTEEKINNGKFILISKKMNLNLLLAMEIRRRLEEGGF